MSDYNLLIRNILVNLVIVIMIWILLRINKMLFRKIEQERPGLQLRFFHRIISAGILIGGVILMVSSFGGLGFVWKTLLGGTAIISAVLIFVAQDVAKDILAGLVISICRPFEIGDRIEVEDGTAGIVKDINMRHVVISTWDTQKLIIPNSRLNTMQIRNNSYKAHLRSAQFLFYIAYGSDVEKAMEVIRQAVMDSSLSEPGQETESGSRYGDVYFFAYEASSLRLGTTVYYKTDCPTERIKTDINLRVGKALKENGIEIPYPYINVVQKNEVSV